MGLCRLTYAAVLGFCLLSYLIWGSWLAWVLLMALSLLPWVSLLLSLPAILSFRAKPFCPGPMPCGSQGELALMGSCSGAVPPFRGRIRITGLLTGHSRRYRPEKGLPIHCGGYRITGEKIRVCDYLGIFAFPAVCRGSALLLILPPPVRPEPLPFFLGAVHTCGEFPRDPRLRPYVPGDPLKKIHQKLSAKTGTLLVLEDPPPGKPTAVVELELAGDEQQLDLLLGEFLWLGSAAVKRRIPFLLRARTGAGILTRKVEDQQTLEQVLTRLLCSPALPGSVAGGLRYG